jgi:outer membrane murein-binding lipoprotein Lpp
MSDKEILTTISSQLKEISTNIECLNQRIDKLEGKTNDMHQ